jgi:hypothetical protein
MSWKKMCVSILLTCALLLGFIMTMNYTVNPLGKYNSDHFPSLVWTGRADKTDLLEEQDRKPDVLVVGSSRSMKIDPDFIEKETHLRAFNAGVNSAKAEDYYVMLKYAIEELDVKPKHILLGIDVEAFHNRAPIDERLLYKSNLSKHLHEEDKAPVPQKLSTMLNYKETGGSVLSLYYSVTDYPELKASYEEDGYLHYPELEREIQEGTFELEIDEYVEKYKGRYNGYTALDESRKDYFREFLELAQKNEIEVSGFITTLHDDVIEELNKTRDYDELHASLINYLNSMEDQYSHFTYEDFDRTDKFNGSDSNFYDGAHIQEENANKITAKLLRKAKLDQPNYTYGENNTNE